MIKKYFKFSLVYSTVLFLILPTLIFADTDKNYCKIAINKTIKCLKEKKVKKQMKESKNEIITNCLVDKFEMKRAKICVSYKKCSDFMVCITGETTRTTN